MESKVADIILGTSKTAVRYKLNGRWYKIPFISGEGMVLIAVEISKMKGVDLEKPMFGEMMANARNIKNMCRAIAFVTKTRFPGIISRQLMKFPNSDILKLWEAVIAQSDPQSFFFIMALAKGMNLLATQKKNMGKQVHTGEGTPS